MSDQPLCELCGEPMPAGEEMFNYHGYSGPCPKPPKENPERERLAREIRNSNLSVSFGDSYRIADLILREKSAVRKEWTVATDLVDAGFSPELMVGLVRAAAIESCARIVEGWHIKKGGYMELAHELRAADPDAVKVLAEVERKARADVMAAAIEAIGDLEAVMSAKLMETALKIHGCGEKEAKE